MGQQQLLLIVLGVIVVGIAVVVGINLFNANAVSSNRDGVVSDLNNLAAMAQQYFKKPTTMGGGGNSFVGWTIPTGLDSTANGHYDLSGTPSATQAIIIGKGSETVGGNRVQATVTVVPTSFSVLVNY